MVSQLLLGEFGEIVDETKEFIRLKCSFDGYEGWCQKSQLVECDEVVATKKFVNTDIASVRINNNYCRVSIGSPAFNGKVTIKNHTLDYDGVSSFSPADFVLSELRMAAVVSEYINTPYLWGGRSVFGIDCSGFSQQVLKMFGISLPRDAYQQAALGEVVGFLQEVTCGDLAFFDNEEGRITHVGILLDNETIAHSSGTVRVDKIDNMGIINSDTGERTHKLRIIKRYK